MFRMSHPAAALLALTLLALTLLALALAAPARAAPALQARSATLPCADTRVTVEAACFPYAGTLMICTRQAIRFTGADGKTLGTRIFKAQPVGGEDVPVVQERFGELACVDTKAGAKFIVATMDNGGNCAQCEWIDVYAPNGRLLGSTRGNGQPGAALDAAIGAAYGKAGGRVLGRQQLDNLYRTPARN